MTDKPEVLLQPELGVDSCDRITLHFTANHQHCGDNPTQFHNTCSMLCKEEAQPYDRRDVVLKPNQGEIELDLGWVKDIVGFVFIENKTRWDGNLQPTPEQRADIDARFIRVLIDGKPVFRIENGHPWIVMLDKERTSKITLLAMNGICKVRITAMPR